MFENLVGNDRVKDALRRMLASKRVPGALLFAGEDGSGKKLFAIELARALNCLSPRGVEACGKCSACARIGSWPSPPATDPEQEKHIAWSEHPDVGLIRPPKRIVAVDQIRQVEVEANFRPFEGAARVFLIEEADRLNLSSANALLKTLEEPPPTSHLILLTARPASLLPTIRSRCQAVHFVPLSASEIEAYLTTHSASVAVGRRERAPLSAADASLIARAARGSLGRALGIEPSVYRERRAAALEILGALVEGNDRVRLLRASEELADAKNKDEYEPRLDVLETLIRDLWMVCLGAPLAQVVNSDLQKDLRSYAARVDYRCLTKWLARIEIHRRGFEVNINRRVATDALFLGMTCETTRA